MTVFTVGIIIDIVIAAILIINAVLGVSRGFIKTAFGFCKLIAAVAAGYVFSKPLAAFLKTTPIYRSFSSNLENSISQYFSGVTEAELADMFSGSSAELDGVLSKFGRSFADVSSEYARISAEQGAKSAEAISEYIVAPACSAIVTALSFVIIFFAALILLGIFVKVLDFAAKAPVINGFNRILGLLAGIFIALLQIFVLIMLFDAALPLLSGINAALDAETIAQNSKLYGFFASVNPLAVIIAVATATATATAAM